MSLNHYGFIVLAPKYNAQAQQAIMENALFRTRIMGVSSVDEAIDAARELINEGVQLIELCGGFGQEKAEQLIAALDTPVPIGYVEFSTNETAKLQRLMSTS